MEIPGIEKTELRIYNFHVKTNETWILQVTGFDLDPTGSCRLVTGRQFQVF
jgi:hypothetical protein